MNVEITKLANGLTVVTDPMPGLESAFAGVWVNTGGASSTDPIYGAIDFGATVTTSSGTLTVQLDTTGWAVFDLT